MKDMTKRLCLKVLFIYNLQYVVEDPMALCSGTDSLRLSPLQSTIQWP